jgi:FkbM family methyltransferase
MIRGRIRRLAQHWQGLRRGGKISFAQCGEDLLIAYALDSLRISAPVYLDLGAFDGKNLSNTFLFYARGHRGVCVEPNPLLCKSIQQVRPEDLCLNVGIAAGTQRTLPFYVLDPPTLSTFDEPLAQKCQAEHGHRITRTIDIPVMSVNEVLERHMERAPNVVSIDTESNDLPILNDWNFDRWRPEIFCVETLEYAPEKGGAKIEAIAQLMSARKYAVYADTYINTVFIDELAWGRC